MTKQDPVTGRFTAERTTTTVTERVTIEPGNRAPFSPAAHARLTAPLEHYEFPVWPQAWWAQADAYRDRLRAEWGPDGIAAFNDASEQAAREAVFGPCRDPLLRQAATLPAMLP